jgi:hypothetical protein
MGYQLLGTRLQAAQQPVESVHFGVGQSGQQLEQIGDCGELTTVRAVFLGAYQGFKAMSLHQTLNGLVVDDLAGMTQGERDAPIALTALVALIDGSDSRSQPSESVACFKHFGLVVAGAARQPCCLEQREQRVVLPQFDHGLRFLGAACRFARTKASNFFRYATSARRYSFSLRSACSVRASSGRAQLVRVAWALSSSSGDLGAWV